MIVNTASKCGFTRQYKDLQKLYSEYKDKNFVIIGFPANNFLGQEPGSDEDIAQFCERNYGVEFPMMSKISVKGKNQHPIYEFLTKSELNGIMDTKVSWNFQKYLIDENGFIVMSVAPKTKPYDEKIVNWINN
jgi:glutathione peroxidase